MQIMHKFTTFAVAVVVTIDKPSLAESLPHATHAYQMPSIHYEVLYLLVHFTAQQPHRYRYTTYVSFYCARLGSARLPVVVAVVVSHRFVRRRVAVGNNFNFWSLNSF